MYAWSSGKNKSCHFLSLIHLLKKKMQTPTDNEINQKKCTKINYIIIHPVLQCI